NVVVDPAHGYLLARARKKERIANLLLRQFLPLLPLILHVLCPLLLVLLDGLLVLGRLRHLHPFLLPLPLLGLHHALLLLDFHAPLGLFAPDPRLETIERIHSARPHALGHHLLHVLGDLLLSLALPARQVVLQPFLFGLGLGHGLGRFGKGLLRLFFF